MALSKSLIPIVDRFQAYTSLWNRARRKQSKAAIHDFRVAARRLLAAVELAETLDPCAKTRKLTARIGKSLRAFSALRDATVQREIVQKLDNSGRFEAFHKFLADAERRESRRIEKQLTDKKREKIRLEIERLQRELQETLSTLDQKLIRRKLETTINKEYVPLLRKVRSGSRYTSAKEFHRTRIGVKRIRYMLEIVHPRRDVRKLRELQKQMGYIHDLGLLESKLAEWPREWSKRAGVLDRERAAELRRAIRKRRDQAIVSLNKILL